MYNIQSHVREYGMQTLKQRPFDTLDSLALAHIIYMPMEGIADETGETTIRQLWFGLSIKYLDGFPSNSLNKGYRFTQCCAAARRYAHLKIVDYQNIVDKDNETQFCACTFLLPDGSRAVAYRGTDMSLAGWKEDFNMAFMTVPAQHKAVEYLSRAAQAFSGPMILCGHSKGGNLAVYAACHTTDAIRMRIRKVYSFDGPGVSKTTITGPGYLAIRERIESWIPQNAVVGLLMCHHPDYSVVKSSAFWLMQHDAFTWNIRDGQFERLAEMDASSRVSGEALSLWLEQHSDEERRFLVEVLFQVFSSIGKDDVSPLISDPLGSSQRILSAMSKLDRETQKEAARLLYSILSNEADYTVRQLFSGIFKQKAGKAPPAAIMESADNN